MGKSSQAKGRRGERELAEILRGQGFPVEPGRAVSFGSTPDISGLRNIHCEVKRVEKLNVPAAMKQAIQDSEKFRDGIPCLFHRRNGQGWLVTMRLSDWLDLYKKGEHNG